MGRIITTLSHASHQALNILFLLVTTSDQRKLGKIQSIFFAFTSYDSTECSTNVKTAEALFFARAVGYPLRRFYSIGAPAAEAKPLQYPSDSSMSMSVPDGDSMQIALHRARLFSRPKTLFIRLA